MIETTGILALVAMAPPGGEGSPGGMMGSWLLPFIVIMVLFYLLLIRPEQKRKQERERMLKQLQRGDEVVTAGGIYGKITALTDKTVTAEVAPNVRIKIDRNHVSKVSVLDNSGKDKKPDSDKGKKS